MKKEEQIGSKELAKFMHDRYEFYSKRYGWDTQENCKVEFDDLPDKNKIVMLKVAKDVLNKLAREKFK